LLLADRELVDAARYMFLTGGDDLVDAARYLVELVGNVLRSGSLRRQPAELRGPACDDLSGRIAVGLPSQGGSHTDVKCDQKMGERARGGLAVQRMRVRETVFQLGGADGGRLARRLDRQQAWIKFELRRTWRGTHLHLPSRSQCAGAALFA